MHTYKGGGYRVNSFADILKSQYQHYFMWGGRVVVHAIGQAFLWWGKPVFNVCNALVYTMLLLVLYVHVLGRWEWRPLLLFLLNLFLFVFTPAFGDDFLWLIGSVNYLWGPLLALSFLLLYRLQAVRDKAIIKNPVLCFFVVFAGVIAGWTNENMAVSLVVMIGIFMWFYRQEYHRIPFWALCGLAGVVLGAGLMIAAPGNFVRLHMGNDAVFHVNFFENLLNITRMFFKDNYLLIPLSCIGILLVITEGKKKEGKILSTYGVGLLAVMYAMLVSPYFPDRAKVGGLLLCMVIGGNLYAALDLSNVRIKRVISILAVLAVSVFISQYNIARKDIFEYKHRDDMAVAHILDEKRKGNLDVVIPPNQAFTRYSAGGRCGKLTSDKDFWTNRLFAKYYGLRSVRTASDPIKPPAGV